MSFKRADYIRTFGFALAVYQTSHDNDLRREAIEVMASVEAVVGQLHHPAAVGDELSNELFRLHEVRSEH
jgi:hypothetical protein